MSDAKKKTHVDKRHGAPRSLPVLGQFSLPADWRMREGVPLTRGDCAGGQRPCPHLSCRHHLWPQLQQDRPGNPASGAQGETILRPIGESCSLDVADRGGMTLDEVGEILGISATRANQIEQTAIAKLRALNLDPDDPELLVTLRAFTRNRDAA